MNSALTNSEIVKMLADKFGFCEEEALAHLERAFCDEPIWLYEAGVILKNTCSRPTKSTRQTAPLPNGWQKLKTAEGKSYYAHKAAAKTQWARPSDTDDMAAKAAAAKRMYWRTKAADMAKAKSDADAVLVQLHTLTQARLSNGRVGHRPACECATAEAMAEADREREERRRACDVLVRQWNQLREQSGWRGETLLINIDDFGCAKLLVVGNNVKYYSLEDQKRAQETHERWIAERETHERWFRLGLTDSCRPPYIE